MDENEQRKLLAHDLKRVQAFRDMLRTTGWQFYTELLNSWIAERTKTLFNPTPPGGEMAEQHNKGAIYALLLARDAPKHTIDSMQALLDQQGKEKDPTDD